MKASATGARSRCAPSLIRSLSTVVAGFVAMMTGYTSSLVLMFQAGQAAHLTDAQISSWIWALSMGMAVCTIGLSLRYRAPIVVAWSTPGAALLVSSLPNVAYADAIGAFIVCAVLLTAVGLTGWFDTLMKRVPTGIAAALLAGILFEIGIEIFRAAEHRTALVIAMFFTYLVGKRFVPRYAIPATLLVGHRDRGRARAARLSRAFTSRSRIRSSRCPRSRSPRRSASAFRFSSSRWPRRTCRASPCCAPTATRRPPPRSSRRPASRRSCSRRSARTA